MSASPTVPRASLRFLPVLLVLSAIGIAGAPFAVEQRQQWIESRPPPTTAAPTTQPPTPTTSPSTTTTSTVVIEVTEELTFVPDDLPGKLDIVLIQDETTSFDDDMGNIRTQLVPAIEEAGTSAEVRFGLAGIQDGLGSGYQKYVELTEDLSLVQSAVDQLGGGSWFNVDAAEPSLSALEIALDGFDYDDEAQKVVVLSTDASSKNQSAQRISDVVESYERAGVRIVVLRPPTSSIDEDDLGAYDELVEGLTPAPESVVIDLEDTSANLGDALLEGLRSPSFSVGPEVVSGCPLESPPSFFPDPVAGTADGQEVTFEITYTASSDQLGQTCTVDVGEGSIVTFEIGE